MITEAKRHVSQLLEINRALTHDLDISHRNAAKLARERDALADEVDSLRSQIDTTDESGGGAWTRQPTDDLALELDEERNANEQLRAEIDVLLRDCEAARTRAYQAEERARDLTLLLRQVEEERDAARDQLGESTQAMESIRHRLYESLDSSLLWELEGGRAY